MIKHEVTQRLLEKAGRVYPGLTSSPAWTYATGDTDNARRMAHSLKGVAGTVAAVRIQEVADRMETILHQGRDVDDEALRELDGALEEAGHGIDTIDFSRQSSEGEWSPSGFCTRNSPKTSSPMKARSPER